jgi:hypothetical protein
MMNGTKGLAYGRPIFGARGNQDRVTNEEENQIAEKRPQERALMMKSVNGDDGRTVPDGAWGGSLRTMGMGSGDGSRLVVGTS